MIHQPPASSRILVTAIGTVAGSVIVSELKRNNSDFYIVGADINEASSIVTSKYVDEYFVFPKSVDQQNEYLEYLLNFCEKKKIDYIYALIDEEVCNLACHSNLFNSIGTKLCLTDEKSVEICHFKDKFYNWLAQYFPKYLIKTYSSLTDISKSDLPLFIKPIEGRASIGCQKIEKLSQLQGVNTRKYVIQQFMEGDVFVVDIIRSKLTKEIQVCQRKEILRNSNGCGIAVEIMNLQELDELGKQISEKLDLNGIISVELFATKEGFKIIEINPRLPAGTAYSCLAGCNTVVNMLHISQGMPLLPSDIKYGAKFARRYETYEM